jgi:hypothetical protein
MEEKLRHYLSSATRDYWGQYQLSENTLELVQYRLEDGKVTGARTYSYKNGVYTTQYTLLKGKKLVLARDMQLDYAMRYQLYLLEYKDKSRAKERVLKDFDGEISILRSAAADPSVYYLLYKPFLVLAFNLLIFNLKENSGMILGNKTIVAFENFFRSGECSIFPVKYYRFRKVNLEEDEFDLDAYNTYIETATILLKQYIEHL